jgi:putative FmdB family regulatory protein
MPIYEYRCRTCGGTFESMRPASDADAPIRCGAGHDDAVRAFSVVARPIRGGASDGPAAAGANGGGACCAAGCACGEN